MPSGLLRSPSFFEPLPRMPPYAASTDVIKNGTHDTVRPEVSPGEISCT